MSFSLFLLIGYLFGSLSSAVIVCQLLKLPDPRTQGSKNPGATNVMRIGGKKAAYLTFAGDFLKGLIPVLIARWLSNDWAITGAALGAFLGHLYPLYFGFKGGKGVATLVGILLGMSPLILLIFGLIWIAILLISGYVSLASMLATVAACLATLYFAYPASLIGLLIILSVLVIYRHQDNIKKLLNGTENHFRKSKNSINQQ